MVDNALRHGDGRGPPVGAAERPARSSCTSPTRAPGFPADFIAAPSSASAAPTPPAAAAAPGLGLAIVDTIARAHGGRRARATAPRAAPTSGSSCRSLKARPRRGRTRATAVSACAPGVVALRLDPLADRDPLGDLGGRAPDAGADGGQRGGPGGGRVDAPRSTPTPAASACSCSRSSLRVSPPSTRSDLDRRPSRATAATTSATRQAIASSAARPMWPARVPRGRARRSPRGRPAATTARRCRRAPAAPARRPRPRPRRAAAASAGGSAARPRSRLSHSSSAPAVKTPPSSAHSTWPSTRQATVGSRPPLGLGPLVAGVGEDEDAGPVGRLRQARARRSRRRRAPPAGRRSAPAAAARPATTRGAACRGRRPCRRSRAAPRAGTPKISSSRRVPLGRAELGPRGGRGVGGEARRRAGRRGRSRRCRAAACRRRAPPRPRSSCSSSQASLPAEK